MGERGVPQLYSISSIKPEAPEMKRGGVGAERPHEGTRSDQISSKQVYKCSPLMRFTDPRAWGQSNRPQDPRWMVLIVRDKGMMRRARAGFFPFKVLV